MNHNITGLIHQMQTVYQSKIINPSEKTRQVDALLTGNWNRIITSSGQDNARALTDLGSNFQNLAWHETNGELQERMNSLARRLTSAARGMQVPKEMQVPNMQMDGSWGLYTEAEMRAINEMRQNQRPPQDARGNTDEKG